MSRRQTAPERMPAECFPPASYIREELSERGWTADEFAAAVGWSRLMLDALLTSDAPITKQQADDISRGFGTSPQFWLNLESAYRRWRGRVRFDAQHAGEGE